jgi:hypothetical protein
MLLTLALAAAPSFAATWYSPDQIAGQSKSFAAAADAAGPNYEQLEISLTRYGAALEELELAVALAGARVPAEQAAWAADTRLQVTAQYLAVQKYVDLLGEDYNRVFEAAVARALPAISGGADAVPCNPSGGLGRMRVVTCTGTDLSAQIAAAVDQDSRLAKELADINSVPWPTVGVEGRAWAPISLGTGADWIGLAPTARAVMPDVLKRRQASMADASEAADAAVEQGDTKAIAALQASRTAWLGQLGEDGTALIAALPAALARAQKKGGPSGVGICVNPVMLGGCTGIDQGSRLYGTLIADKKLAKVAAKRP